MPIQFMNRLQVLIELARHTPNQRYTQLHTWDTERLKVLLDAYRQSV